jgi:hypothetical protein
VSNTLQKTITDEGAAECFVRGLLSAIDETFPELFELLERIVESGRPNHCPCNVKQIVASHIFALEMIVLGKGLPEDQANALRRPCIETFAVRIDRTVEEVVLEIAAYDRLYKAHQKPEAAMRALARLLCERLGVKLGHQNFSMTFQDLTALSALRVIFAGLIRRRKRLLRQTQIVPEQTQHIRHLP